MTVHDLKNIRERLSAMELAKLIKQNERMGTLDIKGLALDSRKVRPGYLFAALSGGEVDGLDFIDEALEKGAVAVLTKEGVDGNFGQAVHISRPNPRQTFSKLASRFYEAQPKHIAAITGTNGKTSIADFSRQLWELLGKNSASIGTLGVNSSEFSKAGGLTTPDPIDLHKVLKSLKDQGTEYVGLEASSHGLEQYRLDGVSINIAAFTNLTRDHLDYHGTLGAYFEAKLRLFDELIKDKGVVVVNMDAEFGEDIYRHSKARRLKIITIGSKGCDLSIAKIESLPEGQIVSFEYNGKKIKSSLSLIGGFQAENALMAAGIVIASGEDPDQVFKALSKLKGVPGRMEFVGKTAMGGVVFIDYAHTPDGLRTALIAARHHTPRKLSIVFGCGGDRDKGKRSEMGSIAHRLADIQYVTDDNPRSEDPAKIRQEILAAAPEALDCNSRKMAISEAIQNLGKGDLLLVSGKGHEEGQVIGEKIVPFSDFEEVKKAIATNEGEVK